MQASFTFEEPAVSLSFRLPFLVFGLLSFGLGLKGMIKLIQILTGEIAWPTHFSLGMLITIVLLLFGCLLAWVFFIPSKKVVIDSRAQTVRVAYQYPFGIRRDYVFALVEIDTPEMVWHKNSEYLDGGFWELKLTL